MNTVNNVAPGTILTPRNEGVLADEEYRKKVASSIPVGFFGESRDISATVLLLASDYGRFITGEDIFIDGGTHL
jgi:NAD(P)-dependent dehydrogenase (short-subunit alcohol dehydrogenase family)